jgi:hypothetical protein
LGLLLGEGDHVHDDVRGEATELGGTCGQALAVAEEMPDARESINPCLAPVEDDKLVAKGKEPLDQEGADEPRPPEDENFHGLLLLLAPPDFGP